MTTKGEEAETAATVLPPHFGLGCELSNFEGELKILLQN